MKALVEQAKCFLFTYNHHKTIRKALSFYNQNAEDLNWREKDALGQCIADLSNIDLED